MDSSADLRLPFQQILVKLAEHPRRYRWRNAILCSTDSDSALARSSTAYSSNLKMRRRTAVPALRLLLENGGDPKCKGDFGSGMSCTTYCGAIFKAFLRTVNSSDAPRF